MTRANVRGPGSRAEADRAAEKVTSGLERGAHALAAADPARGPQEIGRLRLRLPAGAGEAEIARAFARAVADARRRGKG